MPLRLRAVVLMVGFATVLAGCAAPTPPPAGEVVPPAPPTEALEAVPMINHIQFGVFEQDVFIERLGGEPGKVYRPTPEDAANPVTRDAQLFTTATMQPHDPTFRLSGPFAKGQPLNLKLSEWLAAWGSAAYLCTGGKTARIDAAFGKLVPNGVYTFWNSRLTFADGAITGADDKPAGAMDGTQNKFTADKDGNARFRVTWEGCADPATGGPGVAPTGSAPVLAIAYHSDGKTYGASPGEFGRVTHVQLFGLARTAKV